MEVRGRDMKLQGRPIRVVAIMDISERKRLEADLRRAAQEWRESFDALAEGILVVDGRDRIVRCNQAALLHSGR